MAQHTSERALGIKQQRDFATVYGRERDGYLWRSESCGIWRTRGKGSHMPIFPAAVSPESLFSRFFWFISLSQKPVAQPLLRGTAPSHLCFRNFNHCSSASLQLVLEEPAAVVYHVCILDNLPNYLNTKCHRFTFYYRSVNKMPCEANAFYFFCCSLFLR